MKLIVIIAAILLLVGCEETPRTCSGPSNRVEEELFATMKNGCEIHKVNVMKDCLYRYPTLYVSTCKGATQYRTSGKHGHEIVTETQ